MYMGARHSRTKYKLVLVQLLKRSFKATHNSLSNYIIDVYGRP